MVLFPKVIKELYNAYNGAFPKSDQRAVQYNRRRSKYKAKICIVNYRFDRRNVTGNLETCLK